MAKPYIMPSTAALDALATRLHLEPIRPADIGSVGHDEHGDRAVENESMEMDLLIRGHEAEVRQRVLHAQELVRQGVYGLCEDCGKRIPATRIEVIPYANRCVGCEEKAHG